MIIVLAGIAYAVIGAGTAALSSGIAVRYLAWLLSLAVFIAHFAYERSRGAPARNATRVAMAVALGAFLLALAGPVRTRWGTDQFGRMVVLSLVLWPLLTGIPAFLVALVGAKVRRRRPPSPQ